MPTKNAVLEIKLCSDLCSGSGFSSSGVVDENTEYDAFGFPYIPSRRIKGCLRECAGLILPRDLIGRMFGHRETGQGGCVAIGNACLKKTGQLTEELKKARNSGLKDYVGSDAILSMYTSVRAQTQIGEDGTAKDNSLRFIRVVNQSDPFDQTGDESLCFYADISCFGESDEDIDFLMRSLAQAAQATRNMGMNRNRGLGSVRCRLLPRDELNSPQEPYILQRQCPDGRIILSYMLENVDPLIISEKDKNDTNTSIEGKSVLGLLAGEYIRTENEKGTENPADTQVFSDLFLNGTVKYSCLTPAVDGRRSFPAPLYLNQLKKTKKYVNLLADPEEQRKPSSEDPEYDMTNGNQPKKLKTKYIAEKKEGTDTICLVTEPEKEIVFHHRHQHGQEDPEALLFSLEALEKGQTFAGEIHIEGDNAETYAKILQDLLPRTKWRLGKSKSAQYSRCRLIPCTNQGDEQQGAGNRFRAGDWIVVTLRSDALFVDDTGNYTIRFKEVKKMLAEELFGPGNASWDMTQEESKSILETTEILGYHTLWNMKRGSAQAIKAGSAFVFRLTEDMTNLPSFVGERTQEGFGEIAVQALHDMKFKVNCRQAEEKAETSASPLSEDLQAVLCHRLRGKIIEGLLMPSFRNCGSNSLGASNIGRITLMLKESLNNAERQNLTPDEAARDFGLRIQSIKTKSTREKAISLIEKTLKKEEKNDRDSTNPHSISINAPTGENLRYYKIDTEKMCRTLDDELSSVMDKWLPQELAADLMKDLWGDYMLQLLELMKYQKKGA